MPTDLVVAPPMPAPAPPRSPDAPSPFDRAPRLPVATLADIVGGLARAEELWRPHVHHDEHERVRIRLLATPIYEVWLLGWTPGQAAGLHDHGGANGAYVVVDGELDEARSTGRPGAGLVHRPRPTGSAATIEAGVVHDLANCSDAPATSLHAYSQPLRSMGFFDDSTPGVHGHRVRTHWVEPVPALLTPSP